MHYAPPLTPPAAILAGLHLVGRHYPAFLPQDDAQIRALVDDYLRECGWAHSDAITDGFRAATLAAGKFSPKFSEIVTAVQLAHRRRHGHASNSAAADAICAQCGATSCVEIPHPSDPTAPSRLYPDHSPHCLVKLPLALSHVM